MADAADLTIDLDKLDKHRDAIIRGYLSAGTSAISSSTRRLEQRLEGATQSAVPGRLWRAWQSSSYPERGPARNPVGTIWIKGGRRTRGAINFWTKPGEVRGRSGQYLALRCPPPALVADRGTSPLANGSVVLAFDFATFIAPGAPHCWSPIWEPRMRGQARFAASRGREQL